MSLHSVLGSVLSLFSCSVLSDSVTPWTAAPQASLSFTISWSLLKLMSFESMVPSNNVILGHHVTPFCSCPQSFPASGSFPMSQLFDQMAKVLELQLQRQSNEYSMNSALSIGIHGWFLFRLTDLVFLLSSVWKAYHFYFMDEGSRA